MATLVFDDTQLKNLSLGGGTWSQVSVERFFGGSAIWPAFTGDTGQLGSLSLSFLGTSISFFGNTPSGSQNIFVSIDGRTAYETFYDDPTPFSALQWYQSPVLSDGSHSINITHMDGTSLDYVVVTAGQSTPLTNQRLIVDDGDPAITYEGSWTRNEGRYISSDNPHSGFPYGNATRQSNSIGSKATFLFSGNNVTVFSVFDWSHLGYVEVKYTLDNSSRTIRHGVTSSNAEFLNGVRQRENTLLYSSDEILSPGDHQLTMEVTASTNRTALVLDYILYTPSFQTLASKPNLNPITTSSTISPSGTISGSISGTSGTPGSSASPSAGSDTAKSAPVGAIVGGVVGGLSVFLIFIILILCRKRIIKRFSRVSEKANNLSIEPFTDTVPSAVAKISGSLALRDTSTSYDVTNASGSDYAGPVMAQHKPSLSLDTSGLRIPALAPPTRAAWRGPEEYYDTKTLGNIIGPPPSSVFRTRMQRLQELVTQLNREIAEGGEGSRRVAELRGRIAELTREDAANGGGENVGDELLRRESTVTSTFPPPYEPRRD